MFGLQTLEFDKETPFKHLDKVFFLRLNIRVSLSFKAVQSSSPGLQQVRLGVVEVFSFYHFIYLFFDPL